MATVKPAYSGSATALTITLASLANNAYRQSTAVDNSTNLYIDALITGKIETGSGSSATGYVSLYLFGYDGTEYSNNAGASDAAFTPDAQANLLPIYTLSTPAASTEYYLPPILVATFAGLLWLPQKWGIIVLNATGAALNATSGNHLIEYQGINTTVA
jgi:hypothetical protein